MKMIRSTSMTSMNGVTLISCASANSSSSSNPPSAIEAPMALLRRARMRAGTDMGAVEIARQQPASRARRAAHPFEIGFGHPRKMVVDDDGGDRRDQADSGGEQRLGDARRDHGEIGGLRFRDADKTV